MTKSNKNMPAIYLAPVQSPLMLHWNEIRIFIVVCCSYFIYQRPQNVALKQNKRLVYFLLPFFVQILDTKKVLRFLLFRDALFYEH